VFIIDRLVKISLTTRQEGLMNNIEELDIAIIGAGILGLSVARSLLIEHPDLRISVFEKEDNLGAHSSGRNSGVLHAGFYYSHDSLKAKFCSEGNLELRDFCLRKNIPIKDLGKVVVTTSEIEEDRLLTLYERGIENQIDIDLLPAKSLEKIEPLARTFKNFIWSPNTAVSDPRKIIEIMAHEVNGLGGIILLQHSVEFDDSENILYSGGKKFRYKHLVNTAGSQADRVAHIFGFGKDLTMVPFMGVYRSTSNDLLPLQRLVYPVPNPINPFLGVHFTISIHGDVKIGPTAIPLLNREQYSFKENWEIADVLESVRGMYAMLRGNHHDFPEILRTEFPKMIKGKLVDSASKLVPKAQNIRQWKKKPPGIRSQLVDLGTGKLVNDFLIQGDSRSTHVLNVVSPGWTAALPFGKHIARLVMTHL
jgi:L-2-hydroxyglutarate oxidase